MDPQKNNPESKNILTRWGGESEKLGKAETRGGEKGMKLPKEARD